MALFKKRTAPDALPSLADDPEYFAASAEYDRLAAKYSAAAGRVTDLERRVAGFGPVEANTPAERAAVAKLAIEPDADPAVKELALTLEALAPLEKELDEARAEVGIRERPMQSALDKLAALTPVVRSRQADAHRDALLRPLRVKAVEALGAALAAVRAADEAMGKAKAHFGFTFFGHAALSDGAPALANLIDRASNGEPEPPETGPDPMLSAVARSRREDAERAEKLKKDREAHDRATGYVPGGAPYQR